jgi:hypothetical protein
MDHVNVETLGISTKKQLFVCVAKKLSRWVFVYKSGIAAAKNCVEYLELLAAGQF